MTHAPLSVLSSDLWRIARQALTSRLTRRTASHVAVPSIAVPLQTWAAFFVRLEQEGRLRGCIGSLSPRRSMVFHDQLDVELQLRPGHKGLILRDQGKAGTFLPMVWEELPEPHAFLQALKVKAGLPPDHWSDSLEIDLFHAETFAEVAPPAGLPQR